MYRDATPSPINYPQFTKELALARILFGNISCIRENIVGIKDDWHTPNTTLAKQSTTIEWIDPHIIVAKLTAATNPASKFFRFLLSIVPPMRMPDAWNKLSMDDMNPKYLNSYG